MLWSAEKTRLAETVLTEMGSAALDQTIQQFLSIRVGRLSDTVSGVFADAASSAGGRLTELLYWDGSQLLAPFYDETTGLTRGTYRGNTTSRRWMWMATGRSNGLPVSFFPIRKPSALPPSVQNRLDEPEFLKI